MGWSIQDGAVVQHQATVPGGTPAAGYATLWVRSSDGHVIRTDSGGVDHDLESGGGGSSPGIEGVIYGDGSVVVNQLYMDAGDRNSYPGTGSVVTDLTGSRSGAKDAAVIISDGHMLWSGATGAVTYTTDSGIENIFDGGGTVIAWIRPNAFGEANLGRIAGTEDSAAYGWYLQLGTPSGSTYRIHFGQNFDTADGIWYTGSTRTLHEWVMVAVSYNSSSTAVDPTFYLNGVADTSTESSTPSGTRRSDSGNDLYIGNRGADDRTFNGAIDMVMLYDTILSAEEIRQIYRVTQSRLRPSLVGTDAFSAAADAQSIDILGGTGGSTTGQGARINIISGATIGSGQAGDIYMTGGQSTGAGHAADIYVTAGAALNVNTARAGDIYIVGGAKTTSHSGDAGDILISGGDKSGSAGGFVGAVTLRTGAGGTNASGSDLRIEVQALNTGNAVGNLVIQGGGNTGSGHPGDVFVYGGDSANQSAGEIRLIGGDAAGTNDFGGHIYLVSGASTNYYTGWIYLITTAQTSGARGSGSINITVGDTYANYTSNTAGVLTLQGSNHTNASGDAAAGNIVAYPGDNASNSNANYGKGGDFIVDAGNQTGTGTALPGDIKLSAGSKTAGNATGGHVYLYAGDGYGTGAGGNVIALPGQKGTGQDGYFEVRNRGSASDKGWRVTEFDKVQTTTNSAVTVMTVGSLTVNGTNLAVDVFVTGHGDTSTTEVASARKIVTFYRDAGTVSAMTYHVDSNVFVGGGTAMIVGLAISGNNVLLQVTGQSGVTVNWSGIVKVKKGGI